MAAAGDGGTVQWCNFTWRRGTVPIWWGVEMKSGGFGDVDVLIAADNPYRGTKRCRFITFPCAVLLIVD